VPLKAESEPRFENPRHYSATAPDREERHSQFSLHRAVGNQAMQALLRSGAVRAKLAISDTNDPTEREAESVAARIMDPEMAGTVLPGASSCNSPMLRRSPAVHHTPANVSGIVERVVHSAGQPLDRATQGFFESRFGQDFSHVRIHTENEAADSARSISALAYSAGEHIVFDSGQYAPHSEQGRRLLAHELTHVVQGGGGTSLAEGNSQTTIRRQPNPQAKPAAPPQNATPQQIEDFWRTQVDDAVRKLYKLSGSGLTSRNVKFLDQPEFAKQYPARDLEDDLFYIFLYEWQNEDSVPGEILLHNLLLFNLSTLDELREFVRKGIKDGFYEGLATRGLREPNTFRITPRDLVTQYVQGTTDINGPRSKREIKIQVRDGGFQIGVIVHEACHFYVSDAFRDMARARKDGNEFLGSAMISKILFEGLGEFFARRVMKANAAAFGPALEAYPLEWQQAIRLVATLGEDAVEAAYFGGDSRQLKRLSAALDQYKVTSPDLLIPGFVVDLSLSPAHK